MNRRNRYSAELKAKIALAALSDTRTLAELASAYKVHPSKPCLKMPPTFSARGRIKKSAT